MPSLVMTFVNLVNQVSPSLYDRAASNDTALPYCVTRSDHTDRKRVFRVHSTAGGIVGVAMLSISDKLATMGGEATQPECGRWCARG